MIYGNGSDGALNVLSGTYNLDMNRKYQFSSINIAAGATLTTNNTTGAVLYILCNGTATIDGTVDLSNKVIPGHNVWSYQVDGLIYSSPGVRNGGSGGRTDASQITAVQSSGFGGGGAGGCAIPTAPLKTIGGGGGSGSSVFGAGANGVYASRTLEGYDQKIGLDGSGSGGGSGGAVAGWEGDDTAIITVYGESGRGGSFYGENGQDGGYGSYVMTLNGSTVTYTWDTGGGGGAGGLAGKAGVYVVIKARALIINGIINTSGTAGQKGGDGGKRNTAYAEPFSYGGGGGGGGGGGSAGNIYLTYSTITDNKTVVQQGGAGGAGGSIYNYSTLEPNSAAGSNGLNGTTTLKRLTEAIGSSSLRGSVTVSERSSYAVGGRSNFAGNGVYKSVYQSVSQAEYEYRVFTPGRAYVGTWQDVKSEFGYSQTINQNASELSVQLARSADTRIVALDTLSDHAGSPITDENGTAIMVQTETANSVGVGTDVVEGYHVDVYKFYGGYEALLDENQSIILDHNNDPILVQFGSPGGKRVYAGYIADYELVYGAKTGVSITLVHRSTRMNQRIFKTAAGNTTVPFNSVDPVYMARQAMDNYISQGGDTTYTTSTMVLSGSASSYDFKLQTTREVMDKVIELSPDGYYHFVDAGENIQYMLLKSATADHTFWYEKHITELRLKKSITQLVNQVYFIGGNTGTADLFKYYEDTTSLSNNGPGLARLTDSRVTLAVAAQALSQRKINEFKNPRYRTKVTITDAVYDIESIKLGQMVKFANFGTDVDNLVLQIVNVDREPHSITLDLDMVVPGDAKRLEEIKRNILSQEVETIPVAPA